jgi:uncharacterized protein (TIGR03067 family)
MMRPILLLGFVLSCGQEAKQVPDGDRFRGEWRVIECRVGAHKVGGYDFATFEGDHFFLTRNGVRAKEGVTFTIDPTATPATIDWKEEGNEAKTRGIYKFEGDRLTICAGKTKRPTNFEAESVEVDLDASPLEKQLSRTLVFVLEQKSPRNPD